MTKRDIKSLVVRYEAFMNATDHASRCLWAYSLREIQNKLDIEMISTEHLDRYADKFGRSSSSFTQETGIAL